MKRPVDSHLCLCHVAPGRRLGDAARSETSVLPVFELSDRETVSSLRSVGRRRRSGTHVGVAATPAACHSERAREESLLRWTVTYLEEIFRLRPQDDRWRGRLPTGQSDVDSPFSTVTSMMCQVGSLPAPCHPEAAAEGSLLRLNASSQGRCFAEAQHDKRPGWLSHHSTGHITLVGAFRMTEGRGGCRSHPLVVPAHAGGFPNSQSYGDQEFRNWDETREPARVSREDRGCRTTVRF